MLVDTGRREDNDILIDCTYSPIRFAKTTSKWPTWLKLSDIVAALSGRYEGKGVGKYTPPSRTLPHFTASTRLPLSTKLVSSGTSNLAEFAVPIRSTRARPGGPGQFAVRAPVQIYEHFVLWPRVRGASVKIDSSNTQKHRLHNLWAVSVLVFHVWCFVWVVWVELCSTCV